MEFKINKRGFWENNDASGHVFDSDLCNALIEYLKSENIKTLYDFGCGMGDYAKRINDSGINCRAYDGNPNTKKLTNGFAEVLDLSNPVELNDKTDCVLCLEVGEHIPKEFESILINNIVKHTTNKLILSWAIIGQGGDGHVNCRENEYIIKIIESNGFVYIKEDSDILRNSVVEADWFKNTIMVFNKIK